MALTVPGVPPQITGGPVNAAPVAQPMPQNPWQAVGLASGKYTQSDYDAYQAYQQQQSALIDSGLLGKYYQTYTDHPTYDSNGQLLYNRSYSDTPMSQWYVNNGYGTEQDFASKYGAKLDPNNTYSKYLSGFVKTGPVTGVPVSQTVAQPAPVAQPTTGMNALAPTPAIPTPVTQPTPVAQPVAQPTPVTQPAATPKPTPIATPTFKSTGAVKIPTATVAPSGPSKPGYTAPSGRVYSKWSPKRK